MNKKSTLTKEELDLNKAIEAGEYESAFSTEETQRYARAAKDTFQKHKTVNVRISQRNLLRLKAKAAREGVSYQTLITGLIHKHI
jgi:predicted DNA binding CopG/RHH family protein